METGRQRRIPRENRISLLRCAELCCYNFHQRPPLQPSREPYPPLAQPQRPEGCGPTGRHAGLLTSSFGVMALGKPRNNKKQQAGVLATAWWQQVLPAGDWAGAQDAPEAAPVRQPPQVAPAPAAAGKPQPAASHAAAGAALLGALLFVAGAVASRRGVG